MIIHGVKNGQEGLYALDHWRDGQTRLYTVLDEKAANIGKASLNLFAPEIEVIVFPSWDCMPYDRLSPRKDVMGARLKALSAIKTKKSGARVIIAPAHAVIQRVAQHTEGSLTFKKGASHSFEKLGEALIALGFNRTLTVREVGEFAMRGDLVDIYPSHLDAPVRIAFFGDDIETMHHFDPSSQLRDDVAQEFTLSSAGEVRLDAQAIENFRGGYREHFGALAGTDPIYEAITDGRGFSGMEHYLPLFDPALRTIVDYADEIVFGDGVQAALIERHNHIEDLYSARMSVLEAQKTNKQKDRQTSFIVRPLPPEKLYLSHDELTEFINTADQLSPFANPDTKEKIAILPDFSLPRKTNVGEAIQLLSLTIRDLQLKDFKVVYSAMTMSGLERIERLLIDHKFNDSNYKNINTIKDIKALKKDQVGLLQSIIPHGFIDHNIVVITEGDVFGDRLSQTKKKKKPSDTFFKEFTSLQVGDLVVHRDHGVGRFDGLESINSGGGAHDCIRLVYDNNDRLFVPVETMDVLSRYGEGGDAVLLDKLGSHQWQARKARTRKNVLEIADNLMKIAAARQLKEGNIYKPDDKHYHEFCARFPFAETDDQLRAIKDVIDDLGKGRPMDRLVCGDVGFGKTEIALRGAFVVAHNGDQVAVTVPTTLLARQHYLNFKARFEGFGLKVAELSRLNTAKENAETKLGIETGEVNIVVGTHALLAESINFAQLGLMIVDEEQRFGVKQKEKLKDIQKDVHVLTLTATPIPRTLQLALTGVRDLSLITTPPVDRLSIRSFVTPFDEVMIKEALMRERYRSGQSFIVCPRVKDMEGLEEKIRELVPDLTVITAHGQMTGTELEERMSAFIEGRYDILLSTTIIESGIDIPRANTMIIHRADMFGLAQLYQLRGRIGRAKERGYAYLTFDPSKALTETAMKRLEVLDSLDQLGGGFQLASHDMDIRGSGNLLGQEQSGHVKEVGIELYQQMLEDAVAEAKAGGDIEINQTSDWTPVINLGLPVIIPENYVPDLAVRIALYRRLSNLAHEHDIDLFAQELIDRFGALPESVKTLIDTIRIKTLCLNANIEKIEAGPKSVLITFRHNQPTDPAAVFAVAQSNPLVKLRPDQKVQLSGNLHSRDARIKVIRCFCDGLT